MNVTRTIGLAIAVAGVVVSASTTAKAQQRGRQSAGSVAGRSSSATAAEIAALKRMLEEEKLARDVYVTLGRRYRSRIFTMISAAESRHMNALLQVARRSGIDLRVTNQGVGQFSDASMGALYRQLVATGSRSLLDALKVGAKIEEMDIADLNTAMSATNHRDIQLVMQNLQRGSRNHLRAFAGAIRQAGGTYIAEHLSQAEFNRTANSPMEPGGGNGGQGRGGRQE